MVYFACCLQSAALSSTTTPKPRIFSLQDLETATSNFSPSSLLGRGSHGSVFLATLNNGRLLAAAKLPVSDTELSILSSLTGRSTFIVNLLGCTPHPPRIAVFEYMSGGSLDSLLHSPHDLPPPPHHRLRLALDISNSLSFLHSISIVHRDIKTSNILIDEEGRARVSDFGLAVRLSDRPSLPPAGTMGYIDPSYLTSLDISDKCDVYSFGVMLMEIVSGRRAIDVDYSPPAVVEWAAEVIEEGRFEELWDARDGESVGRETAEEVAALMGRCTRAEAAARPCMAEVAARLAAVVRGSGMSERAVNEEASLFLFLQERARGESVRRLP